jgi:hypothetical protein
VEAGKFPMPNRLNVTDSCSPRESLNAAINQFVIALEVGNAIHEKRWEADELKENMLFKGTSESLYIPIRRYKISNEGLKVWAEGIVYSAILVMCIAANEALERTFSGHPYDDPDSERKAIRCIMYMIRCAWAHNPVRPTWQCKSRYQQTFEIPSLNIKLSFADLNGKGMTVSDLGGWSKIILLADRCLELVS